MFSLEGKTNPRQSLRFLPYVLAKLLRVLLEHILHTHKRENDGKKLKLLTLRSCL